MAFRLHDLCKTTRRASGHGLPRLFPRLLADDRLDPRLGIALRFFETPRGRPRREFDAEALVTLCGDPRWARCLIRCLSRTRPLADGLGAGPAAALAERGLARRLDCPEEEVGGRLSPVIDPAGDLAYIDGVGLATGIFLGQAPGLIHEELSGNRARLDLARIGGRLRGLVGRNAGLHALIAYLRGAIRPAD